MIVKMKKLTLLCTRDSREETLLALRTFGAVHLQPIQQPEGTDLEEARNLVDHLNRALEVLPKHPHVKPSGKTPHDVVKSVWTLIHRKQALTEQIDLLELEIGHLKPFGSFSPETVRELAEKGVSVKLARLPLKGLPAIPDGVHRVELSRDRSALYVAFIYRGERTFEIEEVPLPKLSLATMQQNLASLKSELQATDAEFAGFAGDHAAVALLAGDAADRLRYLEARAGMGSAEAVWYVRGFFPAEEEKTLRAAAVKQGWAVVIEDPAESDTVPTLLRHPKWVTPIKAALKLIEVVPGYRELDVSAVFLIFLSIFFAFIIGDAGYGILFIALTLWGKKKAKGKPDAQPGLNLMLILSSATILFGVMTGTYFGMPIESLPKGLQALTNPYMTGWTGEQWNADLAGNHIMFICFSIAVVHLSIAHLWNIVRKINTPSVFVDIGWLLCTWGLYTVVLQLVLNVTLFAPVQSAQIPVIGTGALFVGIGLLLTKNYIKMITLFLDIISNFVDIISYIRLYAVGAASLAVAQAFNEMAVGVGFNGLASLGAALILFAGHGLNIILGAMGVMVHGIRLNTLEFSGHAGVEWAGINFNPFKKNERTFNESNH
ncbi:MAG: hypothetical protein FJ220_00045 [Kiritimatiellaceae bacterium]|nr:hypothetical protein [Kiritimatiellaceae bacterium]